MISPNNGSFDNTMKKPGISVINHGRAPDTFLPGTCGQDDYHNEMIPIIRMTKILRTYW